MQLTQNELSILQVSVADYVGRLCTREVTFILCGWNDERIKEEIAMGEELLHRLFFDKQSFGVTVETPSPDFGSFTDPRDGQTYRTVKMPDGKVWMAQNLNYDIEGSCCYGNDPTNGKIYGRLYTWDAAMKAAPEGWRLPNDDEWAALINAVGDNASTKLKSKTGWKNNGNGTDDFGFEALPGGYGWDGSFDDVGNWGSWWSATESDASGAWNRFMNWHDSDVDRWDDYKTGQLSVRCLQD